MNDAKSSMVIQELENKLEKKYKEVKELKKERDYYHDTMIKKKTVMEEIAGKLKRLVKEKDEKLKRVVKEKDEKLKRLVKEKDEKLKRVVKEKDEKLKRVVEEKDKEMKKLVKENDEKLKRVVKEKEKELIKRFEEFSDDGSMIRIEKLEETNVLWNFEQGREASKEEVIQYLLKLNKNYQLLKTHVDLFCCCA